jgi:Protein of unknown function (DUF1566)
MDKQFLMSNLHRCKLILFVIFTFNTLFILIQNDILYAKVQEANASQKTKYQQNSDLPLVHLRSSYENDSKEDIITMLKKYNFFDSFYNETGNFANDYELKEIKGEKVVIDHATGLMWHQYGSTEDMIWGEEKNWIRKLNKQGYAGYNDWRLPTVEEAASLLDSGRKNADLFVDPVFDTKQRVIWTGDRYGLDGAWCVSFFTGSVQSRNVFYNRYTRPVRSTN